MLESCIALFLLAELGCVFVSWYRLQDPASDIGEALTRALALTLAGLGIVVQLFFALGLARFPWLLDAAAAIFFAYALRRGKRRFFPDLRKACRVAIGSASAWVLAAGCALLALTVWVAPPANWDSMTYNLARVCIMMRENTLAPEHINTFRQVSFSPGFDLLHWFFLRYHTDRAIAIFSFLAYLTILAGSFSVVRRYGDARFALRTTLVVASLTLLPLEATSTKNDIGAAAMAMACLIGTARLLDRPGPGILAFFVTCACYGLSTKAHFAFLGAPLTALLFLARRRELAEMTREWARRAPLRLAFGSLAMGAVLALCLGSQGINLARYGDAFGPRQAVALHENHDGLPGAAANLTRYVLNSIDIPGKWWFTTRRDIHAALFGPGKGPGATMAYNAYFAPGNALREDSAAFGLLGAVFVIPCTLLALFRRRDTFVRLAAVAQWTFFLAICATITWFSFNNRFLTLFFAASAPALAGARGWWHDRKWVRLPVLVLAVCTLGAATLGNQDRPLVDAAYLPKVNPPFEASLFDRPGGRRGVYDAYFHGPLLLDYLSRGLYPGGRGLLVAGKDSWVYPILFYGHRQHWLVMGEDAPTAVVDGERYDMRQCPSLRRLVDRFDVAVVMESLAAAACLAGKKTVMTTRAPWGNVSVFAPDTAREQVVAP
ncbi:MAG: glycosyltransferase family 39 protein [Desulfovibrio sp.]